MTPVIKVCGIQSAEEALGAVEAGANSIGMLLGVPDYVKDRITPDKAKIIVKALPEGVRTVMVTHLIEITEIIETAKYTGVNAVQLHNEISPGGMKELRINLPGIELIKAVHITDEAAIDIAKEYGSFSDMLLLDTKSGKKIGGTGKTHDWDISERIVRESNIPVILAGGLNPENIEEAIKKVKPAGIDANSGLENEDGTKDFEKVRLFAKAGEMISKYLL